MITYQVLDDGCSNVSSKVIISQEENTSTLDHAGGFVVPGHKGLQRGWKESNNSNNSLLIEPQPQKEKVNIEHMCHVPIFDVTFTHYSFPTRPARKKPPHPQEMLHEKRNFCRALSGYSAIGLSSHPHLGQFTTDEFQFQ